MSVSQYYCAPAITWLPSQTAVLQPHRQLLPKWKERNGQGGAVPNIIHNRGDLASRFTGANARVGLQHAEPST
jgi:hypothetical protein